MSVSGFADRFWFSRKAAGIGAPTLMKEVGEVIGMSKGETELSASLISTIERKSQKSSRYNDAFAKVLRVDPKWLATGKGTPPKGFDTEGAHSGRLAKVSKNRRGTPLSIVSKTPRGSKSVWATPEESDEQKLQRKQAELTRELIEFAIAVGPERMTGYLRSVEPLLATFGTKKIKG